MAKEYAKAEALINKCELEPDSQVHEDRIAEFREEIKEKRAESD